LKTLWILTHEFYPKRGGIGVYVEALARSASRCHAVTVWVPQAKELEKVSFPFSLCQLPVRGTQNLSEVFTTLFTLVRACEGREDVVLCFAEPAALRVAMLGIALGVLPALPCVLVLHGSEIQQFYSRWDLRFLFSALLRRAVSIGTVSEYNRKWLVDHFSVSDNKIQLVPGTLKEGFGCDPKSIVKLNTIVTLITVGRIHPRKGQLAVLEALSLIPKGKVMLRYRIIGPVVDVKYAEQLRQLAKKLPFEVLFENELSDEQLKNAYQQSDVFIMTSMPYKHSVEGFGIVYLEAGAYGLPSIAHDVGGVYSAVLNGKTGLLVDHRDRSALADAIVYLCENTAERRRLGDNAYQHAKSWTWDDNRDALFGRV